MHVGKDSWVGAGSDYGLSNDLLQVIHSRGIHKLANANAKNPQIMGRVEAR